MDIARKTIKLEDGREISVFESTWEASANRTRIEETARADRLRLNGTGDPVFLFFLEVYYSYLGSCSSGSIPSPEEAFSLSDRDLDHWYRSIVEVNPEGFKKIDFDLTGEVVFRDGASFRIVSAFLPSVTMKRVRLEEEGLRKEADREKPKDVFSVYVYPLLASCSIGEIPSPEEVKTWPEVEIYKWRDAVEQVNPHLFETAEERALDQARENKEVSKKN